ncbi:MAG: hypothetical protein L3J69_05625 [Desulfobacula sp.]|nr:hypothetical protein [Desulfobacula sp.]
MAINSLQGSAAYANTPTSPVENAAAPEQNLETTKAQLNTETAETRQAFEVTLSQDAQERINQEQLAAKATNKPEPIELTQPEPIPNPDNQTTPPEQGSGPIVNIVA